MEKPIPFPENMGATMSNVPQDFQIAKLTPDDLDSAYNLYCNSNLIMPPGFDDPILKAESTYDFHEFVSILQDDKTVGIVCNAREPFQEYYKGQYSQQIAYISVFRGFMVYEYLKSVAGNQYSIVFCEAEGYNKEVFQTLIDTLKLRLSNSKKCNRILWEITEDRTDLIKVAFGNSFTKKEMVRSRKQGTPDIFIFEFLKPYLEYQEDKDNETDSEAENAS